MRHLISVLALLIDTDATARVVEFACQQSISVPASKEWVTLLFDTKIQWAKV